MKRLAALFVIAALVLGSGGPASAELIKNLRLGGQIDLQATSGFNISDFSTRANAIAHYPTGGSGAGGANNDRIGDVQTRLMVHLDWDLLDDVHAKVTLRKNDREWGTNGGASNPAAAATNSQSITTPGGTDVLGNIFLDQAYFKIDKVAGQIDVTMGRQFYGESNDIVIYYGPSDKTWYGLPVTAIDAARVDWGLEWLSVSALAGKTTSRVINAAVPNQDVDVRGINMMAKSGEDLKASLYIWNRVTHATGALGAPPTDAAGGGGKNDNLFVVGTKLKAAGGGFWIKGEFDQNFGDNRALAAPANANFASASHYVGFATMGNAGFKAESDSWGSGSVWGEIAAGSGRKRTRENSNEAWTPIASDYRPGSIYGRFQAFGAVVPAGLGSGVSNITGTSGATPAQDTGFLSNRVIWGSGFRFSPAMANKFGLGVSYWDFRIFRSNTLPNGGNSFNGNTHIGSEIDMDLTWTHSENVAFAAGYGNFQPGGLIYEAVKFPSTTGGQGVNPASLVYFDTRIKF